MPARRKLILLATALMAPVLIFGLPVALVLFIGPQRTEALARWLSVHRERVEHTHPAGVVVPAFSLIDQDARAITDQSLRGHVWVASFFLSRCAGTCPMTSTRMASLQRTIADERVKLVSFSMDSSHDTPDVLREYATRFHAASGRWHMVTGDVRQITGVVEGLGLAEKQGQRIKDMIHSDRFVLIDRDGRVRGFYESGDEASMEHLLEDATKLAGEVP